MALPIIDSRAVCLSRHLGSGVVIGSFSHIAQSAEIGEGTVIGSGVVIPEAVRIGPGVSIGHGVVFAPGTLIGAGSHIGSGVVFEGPHKQERLSDSEGTTIGTQCHIGPNTTICVGLRVGDYTRLESGSVLTASAQPHSVMAGNPARVIGFSGASDPRHPPATQIVSNREQYPNEYCSQVRGVRIFHLPFISDPRGNLSVGEFGRTLPFEPKRYFVTFDIPSANLRGEHAHKKCDQFLTCVSGSCAVVVDDGERREEFLLDHPTVGIWVPRMTWATEYKHSADSVLLVFASEHYSPDDYIRDYSEFLKQVVICSQPGTLPNHSGSNTDPPDFESL